MVILMSMSAPMAFLLRRLPYLRLFFAAALLSGLVFSVSLRAAEPVDAEIMLLVDVSRSVDAKEYLLQRDGYVAAFRDPALIDDHVARGRHRRIAVSLIYWSSPSFKQLAVPWTVIDGVAAAEAFADAIIKGSATSEGKGMAVRPFDGTTAPGSAIAFAYPRFFDNAFDGVRKIMIVSGDGPENDGISTSARMPLPLAHAIFPTCPRRSGTCSYAPCRPTGADPALIFRSHPS